MVTSEMAREGQTRGPALAALGAGAALLSLWAPWYAFQLTPTIINSVNSVAPQLGILGPYVQQATQEARIIGPIDVSAWDVFEKIDIVIAIVATLALILSLLALTGRARGTGKIVAAGGAIVVAVAVFRIVDLPLKYGVLHVKWGAYGAVAAGILAVVGGVLTAHADNSEEPDWAGAGVWTQVPAGEPAWAEGGSVPPPTM